MLKRYLAIIFLFLSAPPGASAQPLIVAHRGASHDAPENTLPAFLEAWRQRADAIEGDFHLTKDGKIVCIHDEDTRAVAGVKKVIKTSTWQELQELDVGRWHDAKWNGTRIPTIDAVLSTVPRNKRILIEVKCGPEIVPALVRQMKASKLKTEQMLVISFDAEVI